MRLKVSYDRRTDGLFVRLSGEVDLSVEEHLSALLEEAMAGQPPPPAVVVDLSGLRFLDCAGVRVLLRAWHLANGRGCVLSVRDPQPIVYRVLRTVRVAEILGLSDPPMPT